MFGRKPKLPIDLVLDDSNRPDNQADCGDVLVDPPNQQSKVEMYLKQLKEHIAEAFEQVKLNRDLKLEKIICSIIGI